MIYFSILLCISIFFMVIHFVACGQQESAVGDTPADHDSWQTVEHVIGIGRVEPGLKFVSLSTEVSGIVDRIFVEAGDTLEKDQMILALKNDIENTSIEIAKARVEVQEFLVVESKSKLASLKIQEQQIARDFKRTEVLYQEETASQAAYETLKTSLSTIRKEIQQQTASYQSARQVLKQFVAELKLAQAQWEQKMIKAPTDGKLLSLDITIGSYLNPGDIIGGFAPSSDLTVWCEIDELFAHLVKLGQMANIRQPGTLDILAKGRVTLVGPWLRKKSIFSDDVGDLEDRRVREVRVNLDPDKKLILGSRVECVILVKPSQEK
jgi:multidrug efflux pump subunit AcrA (membrane-fusion protein)